jgi:putative membrane protein
MPPAMTPIPTAARPPPDSTCGPAPVPQEILERWNLDPVLIACLCLMTAVALLRVRTPAGRWGIGAGAAVLAVAFVSPVCALSSALFSARILHHLLLVALAAPLLAAALPRSVGSRIPSGPAVVLHAVLFWTWHAPAPYEAALQSGAVYWLMELSLLGSAVLLWGAVLDARRHVSGILALLATMAHMGLLGALLTFAASPLYAPHLAATGAWGLSPLQDQQIAGLFMWTFGALPYLAAAVMLTVRRLDTAPGRAP